LLAYFRAFRTYFAALAADTISVNASQAIAAQPLPDRMLHHAAWASRHETRIFCVALSPEGHEGEIGAGPKTFSAFRGPH
jgi:hypothetical protein